MNRLLLKLLLFLSLLSCVKEENPGLPGSYSEYLSDKAIMSINIIDSAIWVYSSKLCDTCYVSPYMSYLPTIQQITLLDDKGFEFEEPARVMPPVKDNSGKLITIGMGKVFRFHELGKYDLLFESNDIFFTGLLPDKNNNLWLTYNNGIACWNGTELKMYTPENSPLPTKIIHGMAVDESGKIWIACDFKGLATLYNNQWEIISNSEIPGLSARSYLSSVNSDNMGNIWFNVFRSDTTSNIIRFDGISWHYEYPVSSPKGRVVVDSQGHAWYIYSEYESASRINNTLKFYQNGDWHSFDVSSIKEWITTINADDKKVYIGTSKGLIINNK